MKTSIVFIALVITLSGTACSPPPPRTAPKNETVVLLHGMARSSRSMNKMAKRLNAEGYTVINHNYPSTSATIDVLTR
ncbi:MAG: hypothetical protein V5783_11050, partial [Pontiella sp.]